MLLFFFISNLILNNLILLFVVAAVAAVLFAAAIVYIQTYLRAELKVRNKLLSVVDSHIQRLQKEDASSKSQALELQAATDSVSTLKRKMKEPKWQEHVAQYEKRKAARLKAQADEEARKGAKRKAAEEAEIREQLLAEEAKPKGPVIWDPQSKAYVPLPDGDEESWRRT